ncbi:MAG: hypothetical protein FJW31_06790 [Acidobacteria bacterium]|nr:hypothetical protein [Acidobacteriota bacterium]
MTDRQFQREVKDVGFDRVKSLLNFEAAELNRHHFYYWGVAQLLLALVLLVVLLDATGGNKFTMVVMAAILLVLVVQRFLVQPAVVELGRAWTSRQPIRCWKNAALSAHTIHISRRSNSSSWAW